MKVAELRSLLKKADRYCLEKAFVESYKQLRKGQKEEIDQALTDILEGKETQKEQVGGEPDFDKLEQQIEVFLKNAYAQNYLVPNRVVPKNQRPKWRFLVKGFIKELGKILPENENYSRAVKLLTDLYSLICEACNYYLFSTEDPFRSIGWKQSEFFALLVKKTFADGYSEEKISKLLLLASTGGVSRESLHIFQQLVLLGELKTSAVKEIAVGEAKKLIDSIWSKTDQSYDAREAVNELSGMILMISIELAEWEDGIEYYFKHHKNINKEITLYCALDIVSWMDEDCVWIKIYEYAVKKKIKPRESLQERYKERIKLQQK